MKISWTKTAVWVLAAEGAFAGLLLSLAATGLIAHLEELSERVGLIFLLVIPVGVGTASHTPVSMLQVWPDGQSAELMSALTRFSHSAWLSRFKLSSMWTGSPERGTRSRWEACW